MIFELSDPLNNKVRLARTTLFGHIYRRHPEMRDKLELIRSTIIDPDIVAKSKKDGKSLLYFKHTDDPLMLMVVGSPEKEHIAIRTSFLVFNTSKGDPIIWQKKIST